jgi:hypothetical protein
LKASTAASWNICRTTSRWLKPFKRRISVAIWSHSWD